MYIFMNNINQTQASSGPRRFVMSSHEAVSEDVQTLEAKRVLIKHLHEASGFTGNTTSNLYTHLGHSNCYLPSSISDEETEGQIHEMTNFPECVKAVT